MFKEFSISVLKFLNKIFLAVFCLLFIVSCAQRQVIHKANQNEKTAKKDFSFAFITDMHISANLDNIADKSLPKGIERKQITEVPFLGFEKALKEIKEFNVDFVMTGGDNMGTESRLYPPHYAKKPGSAPYNLLASTAKRMHQITSRIGLPVYYANGNHDVYHFSPVTPKDKYYGSKFFASHLGFKGKDYYSFDKNGWHFIVLNTFDGMKNKFNISDKQLKWLEKDLKKIDKNTPIVISGHAPLSLRKKYEEKSNAVYDLIKNHNVKLMLFGHFHSYYEYTWHDIPCVVGSSLSGAVWALEGSVRDMHINDNHTGDVNQGYLIVSVVNGEISWKHYPFTYNIEKFYYDKTKKRPSIGY